MKYVGEYKDGKVNGQGTMTFPDGSKMVGNWKVGNPWKVILYSGNGEISGRIVNGDNHKGETLYGWGNTLPYVWKGVGDKETNPKY